MMKGRVMTAEPRILRPKPLTSAAFALYGDVLAVDAASEVRPINEGHTDRYHDLAGLDLLRGGGRPALSIFRSRPKASPLTLTMMERHPLSSQAFMPLGDRPWLVVVAPAGVFDPAGLVAFLAGPGQGVNYHAGIWHHYCLALGEESDFLVLDRVGPGENCDEVVLDPPVRVDLGGVAP